MSYFWNGYVLHNFLFKGLDSESIPGLIGVCIGVFSVALLYEGLRSLKSILVPKYSESGINRRESPATIKGSGIGRVGVSSRRDEDEALTSAASENANLEALVQNGNARNEHRSNNYGIIDKISHLFLASSFHAVYVFLGFSLMNAVMTFNIYIFIASILGIGLGYFLFYDYSRLKFPYGIPKPDAAQCQALLPPEEEDYLNILDNGGPSLLSTSETSNRDNKKDNKLVVQAEIYNVPLPTNSQVLT